MREFEADGSDEFKNQKIQKNSKINKKNLEYLQTMK